MCRGDFGLVDHLISSMMYICAHAADGNWMANSGGIADRLLRRGVRERRRGRRRRNLRAHVGLDHRLRSQVVHCDIQV